MRRYYECTVKKYQKILWMYSKEVGEDTMNVQYKEVWEDTMNVQ